MLQQLGGFYEIEYQIVYKAVIKKLPLIWYFILLYSSSSFFIIPSDFVAHADDHLFLLFTLLLVAIWQVILSFLPAITQILQVMPP